MSIDEDMKALKDVLEEVRREAAAGGSRQVEYQNAIARLTPLAERVATTLIEALKTK